MTNELHLYFDDSGSRNPDSEAIPRRDGIDCFALGGILVEEENIENIIITHREFCNKWNVTEPLHSTKIRSRQKAFAWLGKEENKEKSQDFLSDLEMLMLDLPFTIIACAIHRPGYNARYKNKYSNDIWMMCKTAFTILAERSVKYAIYKERKLRIFFEESGKDADRAILEYAKELKTQGMYFDPHSSAAYMGLTAEKFKINWLGEPQRKTKKSPMIQLADLVLYPIIKGRYDPSYRTYESLKSKLKLVDCVLEPDKIPQMGIKYSCFDDI
ncbi:DUF3800 domain-containing protein [Nostoc sp.]|uniref:DUF3800 domain-containing protein n=1 Tax=Nostoc sp. TaxID=1180 RepID=UPI002FFA578D